MCDAEVCACAAAPEGEEEEKGEAPTEELARLRLTPPLALFDRVRGADGTQPKVAKLGTVTLGGISAAAFRPPSVAEADRSASPAHSKVKMIAGPVRWENSPRIAIGSDQSGAAEATAASMAAVVAAL